MSRWNSSDLHTAARAAGDHQVPVDAAVPAVDGSADGMICALRWLALERHTGQSALPGARMVELALNLDCVDDETRESRSAPTGAVLLVSVVEDT